MDLKILLDSLMNEFCPIRLLWINYNYLFYDIPFIRKDVNGMTRVTPMSAIRTHYDKYNQKPTDSKERIIVSVQSIAYQKGLENKR
jgi:hypothetical protein